MAEGCGLPAVPGKVGRRRAGKTVFLQQLQAERRIAAPPGRAVYLTGSTGPMPRAAVGRTKAAQGFQD